MNKVCINCQNYNKNSVYNRNECKILKLFLAKSKAKHVSLCKEEFYYPLKCEGMNCNNKALPEKRYCFVCLPYIIKAKKMTDPKRLFGTTKRKFN